jgi:hypothetical protein
VTLEYAPERDPTTKGIVIGGNNLWPGMNGYRRKQPWTAGWIASPVLSAGSWGFDTYACSHYSYVSPTDGYTKWMVDLSNPTAKFLFRITDDGAGGYVLTNVTPGGGLAASWPNSGTLAVNRAFDFAHWGANCYATCDAVSAPNQGLYGWTGGATFTLIATSPQGRTVEVFKDFVIVGNITNTFGGGIVGTRDMIAWCDQGNPTVWTPAVGVQANWNRLRDSPGNIVAIRRLGDACVVYMTDSIYLMRYIGPPYTFSFEKVVDGIGCDDYAHTASVCNIGNAHIFSHRDRVYLFDGSRPRAISQGRVENVGAFAGPPLADLNIAWGTGLWTPMHFAKDGVVTFGNDTFAYNYYTDKWSPLWGAGYKTVAEGGDAFSEFANPTWVGGVSLAHSMREWAPLSATHTYANYSSTIYPLPYNELALGFGPTGGTDLPIAIRKDIGVTDPSYYQPAVLVTGFEGSHDVVSQLSRVQLRFASTLALGTGTPNQMVCRHEAATVPEVYGGTPGFYSTGITWDNARRRFDLLKSSRWHRLSIEWVPALVYPNYGELAEVKMVFNKNGGKD